MAISWGYTPFEKTYPMAITSLLSRRKAPTVTGAGPVMNELVNHPEWMPLLLDDRGEAPPRQLAITMAPWVFGSPKNMALYMFFFNGSIWL